MEWSWLRWVHSSISCIHTRIWHCRVSVEGWRSYYIAPSCHKDATNRSYSLFLSSVAGTQLPPSDDDWLTRSELSCLWNKIIRMYMWHSVDSKSEGQTHLYSQETSQVVWDLPDIVFRRTDWSENREGSGRRKNRRNFRSSVRTVRSHHLERIRLKTKWSICYDCQLANRTCWLRSGLNGGTAFVILELLYLFISSGDWSRYPPNRPLAI